jgi:hypothetical protein
MLRLLKATWRVVDQKDKKNGKNVLGNMKSCFYQNKKKLQKMNSNEEMKSGITLYQKKINIMNNKITDLEHEAFKALDEVYAKQEEQREKNNQEIIKKVKTLISNQKFISINKFLSENEINVFESIVSEKEVIGEKQKEENYWFKYIYIKQWTSYSCDDFKGYLFFPLTEDKFLKVYYEC